MLPYKELNVYQNIKELISSVYQILRQFPQEEKYAISDQLRRASVSIASNLAEGMSRFSGKEKRHFIEMSYGSLMEVDCQLDIAQMIGYITPETYTKIENDIELIAKRLSKLRSSIPE